MEFSLIDQITTSNFYIFFSFDYTTFFRQKIWTSPTGVEITWLRYWGRTSGLQMAAVIRTCGASESTLFPVLSLTLSVHVHLSVCLFFSSQSVQYPIISHMDGSYLLLPYCKKYCFWYICYSFCLCFFSFRFLLYALTHFIFHTQRGRRQFFNEITDAFKRGKHPDWML